MNQTEVKKRRLQLASCFLGLVNICLWREIIGDNGVAYLVTALLGCHALWIVTGGFAADALGRAIRIRNSRGQYKNAAKMKSSCMLFLGIAGAVGSLLMFFGAGGLAGEIFRMPHSEMLFRLASFGLFFAAMGSVLSGGLQGEGEELPGAVSGLVRQLLLCGSGCLLGTMFKGYGEKVSVLLGNEDFTAMYGGMGIALAMSVTEAVIFVCLLVLGRRSRKQRYKTEEGARAVEGFVQHIQVLYGGMGTDILLKLLESIPLWLGLIFFQKKSSDVYASAAVYGAYAGGYLVLCGMAGVLIMLSLPMLLARVSSLWKKENYKHVRQVFQGGVKLLIVQVLFAAVYGMALSANLSSAFGSRSADVEKMLSGGSILLILAVPAFYFSGVLSVTGKKVFSLLCAAAADVAFAMAATIGLNAGADYMAVVYAGIVWAAVYCIGTGFFAYRYIRPAVDLSHMLAAPAGSVCVTGLFMLLISRLTAPVLGNAAACILCLVLGGAVYWVLLLLLHCFREQELKPMPGSRLVYTLGRLLGVF